MEATLEHLPRIYALEPVDGLCDACQHNTTMRVIVLPPAVTAARALPPMHRTTFQAAASDEDDLANATWEDAEWQ